MATFGVGQEVEIPCRLSPGAFPGEYLVKVDTVSGPITGFVRENFLSRIEGTVGHLRAIIKEVTPDTITVLIRGSFFTTTGLADLSQDWAESHLELAV